MTPSSLTFPFECNKCSVMHKDSLFCVGIGVVLYLDSQLGEQRTPKCQRSSNEGNTSKRQCREDKALAAGTKVWVMWDGNG